MTLWGLDLWGMRPSYVNALAVHRRAWRIGFAWGVGLASVAWSLAWGCS